MKSFSTVTGNNYCVFQTVGAGVLQNTPNVNT
jgi:hypothetical protein